MKFSDEKLNRTIKILAIITLVLLALFLVSQFSGIIGSIKAAISSVVVPFLTAFFISFLIYPIVVFLEDKGLRPRWLVVSLIFILIAGLVILVFSIIIPIVTAQLSELITDRLPALYQSMLSAIEKYEYEFIDDILKMTQSGLKTYALNAVTKITTSIPILFEVIVTMVLIPIILFFMLKDRDHIADGIVSVVPSRFRDHFIILTKRINDTIGLYFRGQFIIMFAIGTVATLGYMVIGLDYAIVFGVIVGLTNIIPYIGATIAAVIPVTYSLLAKDATPWYMVLILNLMFQFVEGNILQPVIMSKQLDMHPLLIIAAILGFGSLLGVVGVIFATPIAGIIKVCILYYKEVQAMKLQGVTNA